MGTRGVCPTLTHTATYALGFSSLHSSAPPLFAAHEVGLGSIHGYTILSTNPSPKKRSEQDSTFQASSKSENCELEAGSRDRARKASAVLQLFSTVAYEGAGSMVLPLPLSRGRRSSSVAGSP
jgi:hypothetical protein